MALAATTAAATSVSPTPPPFQTPRCGLPSQSRKVSTFPLRSQTSSLSFQKTRTSCRKDIACPAAAWTSAEGAPADAPDSEESSSSSAADVVMAFYDCINSRDVAAVADLIADDCVIEDLFFSGPFVGRQAILTSFKQFVNSYSLDFKFVIDDISNKDSKRVGVIWHLEWQGRSFPFSRGCSFYKLEEREGRRQIIYERDIVEAAIKPGELKVVAIKMVTSLLQHLPLLENWL